MLTKYTLRSAFGGAGLLVGLAALLLVMVPAAQATEVTPTSDPITVDNVTPTDFIPENANVATGVRCEDSEAQFTVSSQFSRNENRGPGTAGGPTGMFSQGDGSVITDMDPNDNEVRAPVFENCVVWNFDEGEPTDFDADVTTNETNGAWTIAAHAVTDQENVIVIGVPANGAVIEVPVLGCQVDVSSDQASSVQAGYDNGTQEAGVDGQIDFTGTCGFSSPAQFEATYEATSASSTPVVVQE